MIEKISSRRKFLALRADWFAPSAILVAFLLLIVAVNPAHEFPQADDWDYARTAQVFADTGILTRSQYSQATVLFHAFVGGLVVKTFGFSFTVLRLTTLALALGALLAFYALLRAFDIDRMHSALGVVTWMVGAEFVWLAFSFMTDIPALCWTLLALLFYVRAFSQHRARDALIASLFTALAFLVRQYALFLPLAFAPVVVLRMARNDWSRFLLAGCAVPIAVILIYSLAPGQNSLTNWGTQNVTFGMTLAQLVTPTRWGIYARRTVQSLLFIGFFLAPLLLPTLLNASSEINIWRKRSRVRQILVLASGAAMALVVITLALRGEWFPYFMRMGMRPYLAYVAGDQGALRAEILPQWVWMALTFCGFVGGFLVVACVIERFGKPFRASALFILIFTAVLAIFTIFFGVWYERYLLPLMPGVILLVLTVSRHATRSLAFTLAGILLLGVLAWALMRDYASWNEARWRVGRELLAQQIPVEKIDAGYEWDAWYLYPRAEEYVRATSAPMIYEPWRAVLDPEYLLAWQPIPHYAIRRVIPFDSPFGANQFYLLQRE